MDSDLMLVFGLFMVVLSVPALISAFAANRSMRSVVFMAAIGGALIIAAYATKAEGYRPDEIPQTILNVIARILR